MACGCSKKATGGTVLGNSATRTAVYQVTKGGEILSEFSTAGEARKAAAEAGARVRVISRPS